MLAEMARPDGRPPYDRRVPTRFEKIFSFGVISIVTLLGILILLGAFSIDPGLRLPLGLILVGYGVIRFWMMRSRYRRTGVKEENVERLTKEDEKKVRN